MILKYILNFTVVVVIGVVVVIVFVVVVVVVVVSSECGWFWCVVVNLSYLSDRNEQDGEVESTHYEKHRNVDTTQHHNKKHFIVVEARPFVIPINLQTIIQYVKIQRVASTITPLGLWVIIC